MIEKVSWELRWCSEMVLGDGDGGGVNSFYCLQIDNTSARDSTKDDVECFQNSELAVRNVSIHFVDLPTLPIINCIQMNGKSFHDGVKSLSTYRSCSDMQSANHTYIHQVKITHTHNHTLLPIQSDEVLLPPRFA